MLSGSIRITLVFFSCIGLFHANNVLADNNANITASTAPNAQPQAATVTFTQNGSPADASNAFEQAVREFNDRHYQNAIDLFLTARRLGLELPKLHFNLGSAYYKTAQYRQALTFFTEAAKDDKLEVLARINMTLCLLKLSQIDQAQQQLQRALAMTDNPRYRQLIQRIAAKHRFALRDTHRAVQWRYAYSLFFGVNDNVTLRDDNSDSTPISNISNQEDDFVQANVSTVMESGKAFNLAVKLFGNRYRDLSAYNYVQAGIEPGLRVQHGRWHYGLLTAYQPATLDGKLYLTTYRVASDIGYRINRDTLLGMVLNRDEYRHRREDYAYLYGHAFSRRLYASLQYRKLALTLNATRQDENRADYFDPTSMPPTERSFSPQRLQIALEARLTLNKHNIWRLSAQTRASEYPLMKGDTSARDDTRRTYGLDYMYRINRTYWVQFRAYRIVNASNFKGFSFTSNSALLGMSASF